MFFSIFVLLNALVLSAVAAYYSILGLMAIFSAAAIPVAIMGVALEISKISATVWLHYHWKEATFTIKSYLVPAIGILMFITSLGVFGFLSKAHTEQGAVSGDIVAKIQLYDEKIKTQRENIDVAKKALAQMDAAVDQQLTRTDDEKGAQRANWLRKSQKKERDGLYKDIDNAQNEIVKLQDERAPIAAQVRKVEAEVGPIKYIAAMIYDNADHSLLEAAVRWVIVIIVSVFDPLAIVLILAATYSIDWARSEKEKRKKEKEEQKLKDHEVQLEQLKKEVEDLEKKKHEFDSVGLPIVPDERIPEVPFVEPDEPDYDLLEAEIKQISSELDYEHNARKSLSNIVTDLSQQLAESIQDHQEMVELNLELTHHFENAQSGQVKLMSERAELAGEVERLLEELEKEKNKPPVEVEKIVEKEVIKEVPVYIEKGPTEIDPHPILPDGDDAAFFTPQDMPVSGKDIHSDFGDKFPIDPKKGDLFLRTDFFPSKLFKWNGDKWIEVDKELTSSYTYNEKYVRMLIDKISSGEFDIDDLSQIEQEQVQDYLNKTNE